MGPEEGDLFLRPVIGPGIRGLLHIRQILRQMGLHLLIVYLVLGKLTVFVHQIVGDHVEFQLLVLRVEDQVILLFRLGQDGAGGVNKCEDPRTDLPDPVHQLHHFLGISGDRGIDYDGTVCEAPVPGGQKFGGVFPTPVDGTIIHDSMRAL